MNLTADRRPTETLHHLIDRHGTWATLRALASVLLRRRRAAMRADDLPDHLRRDVGLPEQGAPPPVRHGMPV